MKHTDSEIDDLVSKAYDLTLNRASKGEGHFSLEEVARNTIKLDRKQRQPPSIRNAVIEECAAALEADAKLCDCSAHSEGDCACGAWDDYKTITSKRAVEIVRALTQGKPDV